MVFPKGKPIRVFGDGDGNGSIVFCGETVTVNSENGKWSAVFPPINEYGGPYTMTAVLDGTEYIFGNIYIGEVYLMAGQSNMEFKLHETNTKERKTNPLVRFFTADRIIKTDRFTAADCWMTSTAETAGDRSALAYLVANEIAEKKGIAVGIVSCYQGASIIESWLPKGSLEDLGINIPIEEKSIDHVYEPWQSFNHDGILYDYALSQVRPFPLSAVVWYQGESDASDAEAAVYAKELKCLIEVMRRDFCDEELPFATVQIADYTERDGTAWRGIQKAQLDICGMTPNVETVISADVCEKDDIHPKTKDKLAARIAAVLEKRI